MAVNDFIARPADTAPIKVAALAASASSAEVSLGSNTIFAINGSDHFHIKFGLTGMAAAAATDFRVPKDVTIVLDTSRFTHIRVYNSTVAAIDVYVLVLSKF